MFINNRVPTSLTHSSSIGAQRLSKWRWTFSNWEKENPCSSINMKHLIQSMKVERYIFLSNNMLSHNASSSKESECMMWWSKYTNFGLEEEVRYICNSMMKGRNQHVQVTKVVTWRWIRQSSHEEIVIQISSICVSKLKDYKELLWKEKMITIPIVKEPT